MKFILNKQIKYYTKETIKFINLIAVALFIVMAMIFMKYKPVYSVSISGEQVGYIKNKQEIENRVQDIILQEGKENIAYVNMDIVPEYQFTFIHKSQETNEEELIAKIQENTQIT